jgi:hypothetical protein
MLRAVFVYGAVIICKISCRKVSKTTKLRFDCLVFWGIQPYLMPVETFGAIRRRLYHLQHPLRWIGTCWARRGIVSLKVVDQG